MLFQACINKPSNTYDVILPHEENHGMSHRALRGSSMPIKADSPGGLSAEDSQHLRVCTSCHVSQTVAKQKERTLSLHILYGRQHTQVK